MTTQTSRPSFGEQSPQDQPAPQAARHLATSPRPSTPPYPLLSSPPDRSRKIVQKSPVASAASKPAPKNPASCAGRVRNPAMAWPPGMKPSFSASRRSTLWVDCRATLRRAINGGGNGQWKPGTSHSKHPEAQPASGRPASWAGPMASAPLGVLSRIDDLPCSQHDYLSQRVHAFSA